MADRRMTQHDDVDPHLLNPPNTSASYSSEHDAASASASTGVAEPDAHDGEPLGTAWTATMWVTHPFTGLLDSTADDPEQNRAEAVVESLRFAASSLRTAHASRASTRMKPVD